MNSTLLPGKTRLGNSGREGLGWRFWLEWVLATAIAVPLGSTIGGLVGEAAHGIIFETFGFAVVGLVVGAGQWFALRRHVPQTGWYVVATIGGYSVVGLAAGTMGWVFGGETGWGMVGAKNVAVRFAVGGTIAGMVVGAWLGTVDGVLQWLSLRRHVSGIFVVASALGEGLGGAMSFSAAAAVGVMPGDILLAAACFVAGGATGGAAVGGLLVLLSTQTDELDSQLPGRHGIGSLLKSEIRVLAARVLGSHRVRSPALLDVMAEPVGVRGGRTPS